MIITRAPFRISFFGGGTDYPAWFVENGGAVLATTFDKFNSFQNLFVRERLVIIPTKICS